MRDKLPIHLAHEMPDPNDTVLQTEERRTSLIAGATTLGPGLLAHASAGTLDKALGRKPCEFASFFKYTPEPLLKCARHAPRSRADPRPHAPSRTPLY